jgi:hypothetical protein
MRWTAPELLYSASFFPVPSATVTRLGVVCPAARLRFDAVGRGAPSGHTVTNVDAVGAVPVRFSTTAVASAGIEPQRQHEGLLCPEGSTPADPSPRVQHTQWRHSGEPASHDRAGERGGLHRHRRGRYARHRRHQRPAGETARNLGSLMTLPAQSRQLHTASPPPRSP